ncbi:MAG: GntR family transcriptional regulator [Oscillospiraceae bacterium]|jgi:GntR family transcriptional regulator|nr:GntR family transcriptional regulator [Oscillospiraceae bacterium]
MIDLQSATPLYMQVKEDLIQKIRAKAFEPSNRLPSEKELARMYAVSMITIRRAVSDLVEEKLLHKQQGKGTFVLWRPFERDVSHFSLSFTEACRANNMVASAELLCSAVENDPPAFVREALKLPPGGGALFIKRLRYANGHPIVIESTYFPMSYAFLLDLDLNNKSLYESLKANDPSICILVKEGSRTLKLTRAEKETAQLLNIGAKAPVLLFRSLVFNATTSMPVHTSEQIGYSDQYDFTFRL